MPRLPGPADVLRLLQAQTEALAALPGTLVSLNRSIRALARAVEHAGETIDTVHRVANRADALLAELDEPLREMGPALRRAAALLNDPAVEKLPETLDRLNDIAPIIQGLTDTQAKVATIAASTERIMAFADDTTMRLQSLPGASLLRRPRREPPTEG